MLFLSFQFISIFLFFHFDKTVTCGFTTVWLSSNFHFIFFSNDDVLYTENSIMLNFCYAFEVSNLIKVWYDRPLSLYRIREKEKKIDSCVCKNINGEWETIYRKAYIKYKWLKNFSTQKYVFSIFWLPLFRPVETNSEYGGSMYWILLPAPQ